MPRSEYTPPKKISAYPASPGDAAGQRPQSLAGWRTETPVFDLAACSRCGLCLVWCPEGAIVKQAEGYPLLDGDWCKGCGLCAAECPKKCIKLVEAPR